MVPIYHLDLVSKGMHAILSQQAHVRSSISPVPTHGYFLLTGNYCSLNLNQQTIVKLTAIACVLAYISTIIVFLAHCHPIYRLWQVYPYPGGKLIMALRPSQFIDMLSDGCALNIPKYLALVVTNVSYVSGVPGFVQY